MGSAAPQSQEEERPGWVLSHPVRFARRALGHRTWWKQEELLTAPLHHDRVAVKACHKSSKTFAAAELSLWWVCRFPDGKVVTTSPNFRQVRRNLWSEIGTMVGECAFDLPTPNQTALQLDRKNFMEGVATSRDVDFAGYSGRILVVIDEAPGVGDEIFQALSGIRAGGRVTVVMLGNPIVLGGRYHEAFTKRRHRWKCLTINAFDTPNVRPLLGGLDPYTADDEDLVEALRATTPEERRAAVEFPDLVRPDWILERWEDEGPGTVGWEARVCGRFPTQGQQSVIENVDYLEEIRDDRSGDDGGPVQVGIDVAGPGEDEMTLVARRLDVVTHIEGWRTNDWGRAINRLDRIQEERGVESVKVDEAAIGLGFKKRLEETDPPYDVIGINVGKKPWGATRTARLKARDTYRNLKAQLYWRLRDKASEGIYGIDDDTTLSQLATIRWEFDGLGKIKIEKKSDRERRGLDSPDRAEGLMLAYAEPPKRGSTLKDLEPTKMG